MKIVTENTIPKKPLPFRLAPNPNYCIFIETFPVKKIFLLACLGITSRYSYSQNPGCYISLRLIPLQIMGDCLNKNVK
jgi:hypothetical protein